MASAQDPNELRERLFHEIKKRRTGMLGLVGGEHMQPMTAFCEEDGGPVWFYCRKENDLVAQSAGGKPAMFCLMTGDDSFIACVGGTLQADHDRERIERFWNPVAGAWFPEGKDDPALTLLRLDPVDAQVWVSHANPLRFGFEIAKANLTKTLPDAGDTAHLSL
jgi:general stress protein 26